MRVILEGLDGSGKTTIGKRLTQLLGEPYLKISKTVSDGATDEETAQAIVNEISERLGEWRGVLDRGYWSCIGTNSACNAKFRPESIVQPVNLYPDIGVLLIADPRIIRERSGALTVQDERVLHGRFIETQDFLRSKLEPLGYLVIDNSANDLTRLDAAVQAIAKRCRDWNPHRTYDGRPGPA